MMRSKGRILNVAAASAIAALFAGGLILGCSNGDDSTDGGGFAGDWMPYSRSEGDETYYYSNNPNEKEVISFMPSGEVSATAFKKAGNVWVEIPTTGDGALKWRTDDQTVYIREEYYDNGNYKEKERNIGQYKISNGRLIILSHIVDQNCENGVCVPADRDYESTYIRTNVAVLKNGLGTIYPYNPKLRGYWVLNDDGDNSDNIYLDLGTAQFSGGNRYFDAYDDNMRAEGGWYTNGDRLYLAINERCYMDWYDAIDGGNGGYIKRCVPTQTTGLPYSLSGTGNNRKLTIKNGGRSDEYYYDYNPPEPKWNIYYLYRYIERKL